LYGIVLLIWADPMPVQGMPRPFPWE